MCFPWLGLCACVSICLLKGSLLPLHVTEVASRWQNHQVGPKATSNEPSSFCLPAPFTLSSMSREAQSQPPLTHTHARTQAAPPHTHTHTHTPPPPLPESLSAALSFRRITWQQTQCVADAERWQVVVSSDTAYITPFFSFTYRKGHQIIISHYWLQVFTDNPDCKQGRKRWKGQTEMT